MYTRWPLWVLVIFGLGQFSQPQCPYQPNPDDNLGACHSVGDDLLTLVNCSICLDYFNLGLSRSTPLNMTLREYYFVVIGGGIAGAIVAARLSANPNVSMLLLDWGGSSSTCTDFPWVSGFYLMANPLVTEHLKSTPQSRTCGANGGKCIISFANILGGDSTQNLMGWQRGTPEDYNQWFDGSNNPDWWYREMLPYLKRIESADPTLVN